MNTEGAVRCMPSAFSTGSCHAAAGAAAHLRAAPVLKASPRLLHSIKPGDNSRPALVTANADIRSSGYSGIKSTTALNQLSSRFSKINLHRVALGLLQLPDFRAIR